MHGHRVGLAARLILVDLDQDVPEEMHRRLEDDGGARYVADELVDGGPGAGRTRRAVPVQCRVEEVNTRAVIVRNPLGDEKLRSCAPSPSAAAVLFSGVGRAVVGGLSS